MPALSWKPWLPVEPVVARVVDGPRVVDGHAADEVDHPAEAGQVDGRVVVDRRPEQEAHLADERGERAVRELVGMPPRVAS